MSKKYFLGIDTSCYTTSCAIVDEAGTLLHEERKLLEVKKGSKGLAQSNMVFQHSRALPILLSKLPKVPLTAIAVSSFPRREKNSYMPAFLVGKGIGTSIGHFLNCPVYEFSHQENHILAALRESRSLPNEGFFSLHLSGGTTELLFCCPNNNPFFNTTIIGKTIDLHCGQLVDRVGVALGLPFPAGPHLERLALQGKVEEPLKISVSHGQISFSGPTSECLRRVEKGLSPYRISAEVFEVIGRALEHLLDYHQEKYKVKELIAVGGVMSNSIIRDKMRELSSKYGIKMQFATPKYSADNATGNAYGASILYGRKGKEVL